MSSLLASFKRRVGEFVEAVAPNTPIKTLRQSIVAGDEAKALENYGLLLASSQNSNPSQPFTSKKYGDQTPLHLAATHALDKLVVEFLKHGGNPNAPNAKEETCLHCVCAHSDRANVRFELLELLLKWKSSSFTAADGTIETVSINRVDREGNAAIHYASAAGLLECVHRLITLGAIISIVNSSQRTCCEMADNGGHFPLARMLELSLVFQPTDSLMDAFVGGGLLGFGNDAAAAHLKPVFLLDSKSYSARSLALHVESLIAKAMLMTGQSRARCETLMFSCEWNLQRLQQEWTADFSAVLARCNLETTTDAAKPSSTIWKRLDLQVGPDGTKHVASPEPTDDAAYTPQTCAICGDEMSHPLSLAAATHLQSLEKPPFDYTQSAMQCSAGHTFCFSCWRQHCTMQINQGVACLPCPGFKCGEVLDLEWAPVLLGEAQAPSVPGLQGRLHRARVRRMLECGRHCRAPDCGLLVLVDPSGLQLDNSILSEPLPQSVVCRNGHAYCLACNDVAHAPCSCQEWQAWKKKVEEEIQVHLSAKASGSDDVASALWLSANTKQCPKCSTAIEKDEGCNHMSCRKCRYEFCWICLQPWSMHGNGTGGFFQCNRFVPDEGAMDAAELPIENEYATLASNLGSAQGETVRQRAKGLKMQRFIHHYTRFVAHSDSAAKEALICSENLRRIEKGLRDTCEGDLLWLQGYHVVNPLEDEEQESEAKGESRLGVTGTIRESLDFLEHHGLEVEYQPRESESADAPAFSDSTPTRPDSESKKSLLSKLAHFSPFSAKGESTSSPERRSLFARMRGESRESHGRESQGSLQSAEKTDTPSTPTKSNPSTVSFGSAVSLPPKQEKETPACLEFLQEGFSELLRCRHLLKGSFALAFFTFARDDCMHGSRHSLGRRARYDLLQGELEIMVEMLSDAVARKRLRASQTQISHLMRACRTKRLEFEESIVNSMLHDAMEARERSTYPSFTPAAAAKQRRPPSLGTSSSGAGGSGSRRPGQTGSPTQEARRGPSVSPSVSSTSPQAFASATEQYLQSVTDDIMYRLAELVDELSQLRYLESEEVGYLEMEAQAGRGEEIVVPEGRVSLEAVRSRQMVLRSEAQRLLLELRHRTGSPYNQEPEWAQRLDDEDLMRSDPGSRSSKDKKKKDERRGSRGEKSSSERRKSGSPAKESHSANPSVPTVSPDRAEISQSRVESPGKSSRRYSSEATIGAVHKRLPLPPGILPASGIIGAAGGRGTPTPSSPTKENAGSGAAVPPDSASVAPREDGLTNMQEHFFPLPPDWQPSFAPAPPAPPTPTNGLPPRPPSNNRENEAERLFAALESLLADPNEPSSRSRLSDYPGSRSSAAMSQLQYAGAGEEEGEDVELNRAIMLSLQQVAMSESLQGGSVGGGGTLGGHENASHAQPAECSPADLEMLISLGYSEGDARAAWQLGGSLEAAANILLNGGVGGR